MLNLSNVSTEFHDFQPISVNISQGDFLAFMGDYSEKMFDIFSGKSTFSGEISLYDESYLHKLPVNEIASLGFIETKQLCPGDMSVINYLTMSVWAREMNGFRRYVAKIQSYLYRFNMMSLSHRPMGQLSKISLLKVLLISKLLLETKILIIGNIDGALNTNNCAEPLDILNDFMNSGGSVIYTGINRALNDLNPLVIELEGNKYV